MSSETHRQERDRPLDGKLIFQRDNIAPFRSVADIWVFLQVGFLFIEKWGIQDLSIFLV